MIAALGEVAGTPVCKIDVDEACERWSKRLRGEINSLPSNP